MSSLWNFIKRNKGKIISGGVLVGGAYAAKCYLDENPEVVEEWTARVQQGLGLRSPTEASQEGDDRLIGEETLHTQTRKHFIFDSNQRTCDASILQLLPAIEEKIKQQFDVESVAEQLRIGVDSDEEKIRCWNQMKLESFSRLIAGAYGYSLLVMSLKAQISILASQLLEQSKKPRREMSGAGIFRTLSGLFLRNGEAESSQDEKMSESQTQQLFLQSLQYFTVFGMDHLMEKIGKIAKDVVEPVSLSDPISEGKLKEMLSEVRLRLSSEDYRNFSYFVVPITSNQDAFGSQNHQLQELLVLLKTVLESHGCRQLLSGMMDKFYSAIIHFCRSNSSEIRVGGSIPLAKAIPLLTDGFSGLSGQDFESVIQDILTGQELHDFCVKIFEKDSSLL